MTRERAGLAALRWGERLTVLGFGRWRFEVGGVGVLGVGVGGVGVGDEDLRSKDRARVGPDGMDDRSASSRSARGVDARLDASCGVC